MCGRYSLISKQNEIKERFNLKKISGILTPRFNVAPNQQMPLIANSDPARIVIAQWGLTPAWINDTNNTKRLINARAETLASKHTFQLATKKRRCLVIADGFYEWAEMPGKKYKQPFYISLKTSAPFAMAGIYNEKFEFAIITTEPNSLMAKIHHRMPAILRPEDESRWLDTNTSLIQAISMLGPYPAPKMKAYPVSLDVNKVSNDNASLIKEIPTQKPLI